MASARTVVDGLLDGVTGLQDVCQTIPDRSQVAVFVIDEDFSVGEISCEGFNIERRVPCQRDLLQKQPCESKFSLGVEQLV